MPDEIKESHDNIHDRLARHWPEPREQLHAGGWAATYELVDKLGLTTASRILDACCGEGGTAVWLARQFGRDVVGVDIVEKAVRAATVAAAEVSGRSKSAGFVVASVFDLPFCDEAFEVIYGQDPDGFAFDGRRDAFAECFRLLKPGGRMGIQHWLLHDDAPAAHVRLYEQTCADMGFTEMRRLRTRDYVSDLITAGFRDVIVEDMSDTYTRHLARLEAKTLADQGEVDLWTAASMTIIRDRGRIGVRLIATRPTVAASAE